MPTFAAVDIGSNSVRLKIARLAAHRLVEIHEDREVTRLGESVFRSGFLSPEAIAITVKVLRRFHRAVQNAGADTVRVVATSALRDARNSRAFLEWVRSTTGWRRRNYFRTGRSPADSSGTDFNSAGEFARRC